MNKIKRVASILFITSGLLVFTLTVPALAGDTIGDACPG